MNNTRLQSNLKIIKLLQDIILDNPDWRFHQLLQNVEIEVINEDKFYEESDITLKQLQDIYHKPKRKD
jgi:hypothetical protein